jgi:hypothetical protein
MERIDKEISTESFQTWLQRNQSYLEMHLSWLRLMLQRKVLWLRQQWKADPLQNFQGQVISDALADCLLTGEDRAAEQIFYEEDKNGREITQAIEQVEERLKDQSNALMKAHTPTALDMLSQIFGLTSFDRAVLLLCLAPEIDPAFERIYAYVQDDITRKYVTPYLALLLFAANGDSEQVLRHSFLPEAPMFKFKLIHRGDSAQITHSLASSPLRIDPRIADYLQGVNRLDERVTDILSPVKPIESPLSQSYEDIVNKL